MNYNNELLTDYASKKIRFATYLLDGALFFILHIAHVLLLGERLQAFLGKAFPNNFCYFLLEIFFYFFIFELAFSRTPGKFLTGTKVFNENGKKPGFITIVIRTLCRFIPFDNFSFLFFEKGWHDSLSKTEVLNV